MKKLPAMIAVFVLACSMAACSRDAYAEGYNAGYEDGYHAALSEAPGKIDFYVEEDMWVLEHDIEDEWGLHPEEAIQILSNHADDPGAISEDDLCAAIWAIRKYYYGSRDIASAIEDYWID